MRHKQKAKDNPCRVYWGSHGCRKQKGHLGNHLCQPGCYIGDPNNPEIQFYGEDYENRQTEPDTGS